MDRRMSLMLVIGSLTGIASSSAPTQAERRRDEGGMDGVGSAAAAKAKAANTGTVSGFSNLKKVGPERAVVAVRSHQGTYIVTTADGRSIEFRENDLRFKIDSSENRPLGREPVIVPTGMTGDRATVIFAPPTEISDLIKVDARIN